MTVSTQQTVFFALAGCTVLTLFWMLKKAKLQNATTKILLSTFFFGLALLLHTEVIYIQVGERSGIGNLAWLGAYISGLLCVHFSLLAHVHSLAKTPAGWLNYGLASAVSALLLLFSQMVKDPIQVDHTLPTTTIQLLFMLIAYVYGGFVCGLYGLQIIQWQTQFSLPLRLRMVPIVWAQVCIVAFSLGRVVYLTSLTFYPVWQEQWLFQNLKAFNGLAFSLSSFWLLFFLPAGVYNRLATGLTHLSTLLDLLILKLWCRQVLRFCVPVSPLLPASWGEQLRNLELFRYRTLIILLDGKNSLKETLNGYENGRTPQWNETQVTQLAHLLNQVDDHTSYEQLMKQYRQLLWKGGLPYVLQ